MKKSCKKSAEKSAATDPEHGATANSEAMTDQAMSDTPAAQAEHGDEGGQEPEPSFASETEADTGTDTAAAADPVEACAQKPLGTSKAVETMFRNATRAELDIIALAATKANIMISLNGLIISALMISGAFIFASSAVFLFPAGVFLFTAAASIIFALLAASPERANLLVNLRDWAIAVWRRKAGPRDIRDFLKRGSDGEDAQQPNLLIYEHRERMSRDEYWGRMQVLLRDRQEIYHQMSDQLYWLGLMSARKFRLLNLSYTIFRWGLLASVLTFLSVKSVFGLFPGLSGQVVTQLRNLGIAEFSDIYEPSGVQQLPDGRILVVEDEAKRAMSIMTLNPDGSLVEDNAASVRLTRAFGRKLTDLEGLTVDDAGQIYAITSHSMNKDGERRSDREQLLRFRIEGSAVGDIKSHVSLRDALSSATDLKAKIENASGDKVDFDRLNIEGLSFHRETGRLLLGLREPMGGESSLIIPIDNPSAIFESNAAPVFGDPVLLALKGGGIRALSFDPVMDAFLIVNEIEGYEGNRYSQLWSWSGEAQTAPEPIALPDIINLNNVESIDSIMINGEPRLLLMSDEGNEKKNRPARYMMLEYGQLVK